MAKTKGVGSKTAVWVIIALLIVGLAGFGATNFGGNVNSVGRVGEREIGVQRYARELQNQMAAFSAQTGTNLTLAQAQSFGLDRAVLQRLVSTVALENEAAQIGLSVGDEEVRKQILTIPAFQGIDGNFDREAYRFALDRNGQNEQQFEEDLRAEIARTVVQGAVAGGIATPDTFADTLVNYVGERRSFVFATFGVDALEGEVPAPDDADLRAYFDANEDDFMLPETRDITYVWLTPDMLVDTVEVDLDALKSLYEDRIEEFVKPERRLVERLILGDAAADAKSRIDAGEATFEDIVTERELALADIDLGDVTESELGEAGTEVFAVSEPGIVGPVDTDLGAALFRVNAILAAQETTFEEARPELVDEFALDRARRVIGDMVENVDDLLAGGATLEELADETEMQLGQIAWTTGSADDVAGYEAFRGAAAAAAKGDFPEVAELDDGGIFALRVNDIVEPRLQEFADARARVDSGWRAQQTTDMLAEQAQALADRVKAGEDIAALGLTLQEETDVTRAQFIPDTPADFLTTVFEMEVGETRVIKAETAAYLVRLNSIAPPDSDDPEIASRRDELAQATAQSVGSDILAAYASAVEAQAGIALDQAAINAVHANFP